jgi:probable rRNA maturation factor
LPPHEISITNESGQRLNFSPTRDALTVMLRQHDVPQATVQVLFADNKRLRQLNREFRQLDEATDVLSFPAPPFPVHHLGEVAVSVEFAERGAHRRKVSKSEEAAFLALHGGLHLLGYDDEQEADRLKMLAKMNEIARVAGLSPDDNWESVPHGAEA